MRTLFILLAITFCVDGAWGESPALPARPPAVGNGKIAEATPWETDFYVVDSGENGPTVLIVGGMHGNEPAGSRAAMQILHWPIVSGKLVVVPRANVLGLEANTRGVPDQPEEAADLNRNFLREGNDQVRVAPRGELAGALWTFALRVRPDWVIDLHEGFDFNRSHRPPEGKKKSVGSSIIYNGNPEFDPVAQRIAAAADATVRDPDRRFSLIRRGPVSTGIAQACVNVMGAEAVILETTFKDQPMSLRTRQHRAMANVLLNHIGLIDGDCADLLAAQGDPERLQVAVYDGAGTGKDTLARVIDEAVEMDLRYLGPEEICPEVLQQFDVIAFPRGSGSKQAGAIGEEGRLAVREFVEAGGGVIGVCAGAYLCSAHYSWSLDLIDSAVFTGTAEVPGEGRKAMWRRGSSDNIEIELSPWGERLFGDDGIPQDFVVRYQNGPIISPKDLPEVDDYRVLAWFRSEVSLWKPQEGTMVNTPAIVSGTHGLGRIISISPHPESTPSLHPIITESIRWTAGDAELGE